MVKINRSILPVGITITKEEDYRTGVVYETLKRDFYEKCYICEDLAAKRDVEIEHRQAQSVHSGGKYDWNNLFYSDHHCNTLKRASFNNIIDCTQVDPEDFIALKFESWVDEGATIMTTINIAKIKDTQGVDETIALLNRIYNGEAKPIMTDNCAALREDVRKEIRQFEDRLALYTQETDLTLKSVCAALIKNSLSRATVFAAFKRGIIRNDAGLMAIFGGAL